jgi:hypothetical protein
VRPADLPNRSRPARSSWSPRMSPTTSTT